MRKLKKAFSLTLALAMCLGLMAVPATALNPGEEWVGDFVVNGDTLVGYYGDGGAVTIPDGITTIGLSPTASLAFKIMRLAAAQV